MSMRPLLPAHYGLIRQTVISVTVCFAASFFNALMLAGNVRWLWPANLAVAVLGFSVGVYMAVSTWRDIRNWRETLL